jgi:DNA-binding protein H-NS
MHKYDEQLSKMLRHLRNAAGLRRTGLTLNAAQVSEIVNVLTEMADQADQMEAELMKLKWEAKARADHRAEKLAEEIFRPGSNVVPHPHFLTIG